MPTTSVPSPGGWIRLWGVRILGTLVVGTSAVSGYVATTHYGSYNGQQDSHYAEVVLSPVTKSGAQAGRWAYPLAETGVVLADNDSYFLAESVPSPASKLIIGIGSATATGSTNTTKLAEFKVTHKNVLTLAGSGNVKLPAFGKIGPGKYLTFSWYSGSGQTVGGVPAGIVRIKVTPCGNTSLTCD